MKRSARSSTGAVGAPLAGNIRDGAQGGVAGSLNLIHTSYSPKPAPMRVTARFDFVEGVSFSEAQAIMNQWLQRMDFAAGPLADLMCRRADGTRTT